MDTGPELKNANETTTEIHIEIPKRYRWRSTFWRIRPIIGMGAILLSILSILFSMLILLVSHNSPVTSWTVQPTVFLAIAAAVSNTSLQGALVLAAPVSWFYRAIRGSTIEDLEIDWEASQSFPRAFIKSIKYRRTFSLFTFASLATALVLIDGPILQRSSLVKRHIVTRQTQLNVSIPEMLPVGFSGTTIPPGGTIVSHAAIEVIEDYAHNRPIHTNTECEGTCSATVRAPGVTVDSCEHRSWPINETMLRDSYASWGLNLNTTADVSDMNFKPLLYSTVSQLRSPCLSGLEPFWVATGFANYKDCNGQFVFSNCTVLPAIVEHKILIDNHAVTSTSPHPRVIEVKNRSCEASSFLKQPTTIGGLTGLLAPYVNSNARLGIWFGCPRDGPVETWNEGTFNAFSMKYFDVASNINLCSMTTRDPMDDILLILNRVMLRAGFLAASWPNISEEIEPGTALHQSVNASVSRDGNVYSSDISWFSGAATVQIFTIILLLATYRGWWRIGVELSLSPFHMAKLFDSPLLKGINSGAGATGVVNEMKGTILKLGCVEDEKPAQPGVQRGETEIVVRTRIGITTSESVSKPSKGAYYS